MAYCIQCGEGLKADAKSCPSCGRAVGASSIGAAQERAVSPTTMRALTTVAALVAVVLGIVLLVVLVRARPGLSLNQLESVSQAASPSLVTITGSDRKSGGVVVRELSGALLVVTQASVAPPGKEVQVDAHGHTARGFGLLAGMGKEAAEFALVLVPDGAALGAKEAKLSENPKVDDFVVSLSPTGKAFGAGRVLSFEDGPGAGSLVHDAPMRPDVRGYGLWTKDGKLAAVPSFAENAGESLAVSANALFERLLLSELALAPGAEWSEHALPVSQGMRIAVALAGPTSDKLAARLGSAGSVVHGKSVWPGLASLELTAQAPAPLQLAGSAPDGQPARVLVVTFGRL